MSEIAEQAAEVTAEVVEETVDGVVDVVEVVRNNPVTLALIGVVGLAVGGFGGYFIAKKKLRSYYNDLAEVEIAEAKEFYANLNKVDLESGDILSPMDVLERTNPQAASALRDYQGRAPDEDGLIETEPGILVDAQDEAQMRKIEQARLHSVSIDKEPGPHGETIEVVEEKEETRNVFVDPNFDYDEELKFRSAEKPYIITHDEYFAAERDYETNSLTYYEVDDTLTNERDEPIREIDKMIGEDHLVRFGHGSKDRNIVYIRNERLETDFEVIKSTGSYLEEVLGITEQDDNSLRHSDQRDRRQAFRRGEG